MTIDGKNTTIHHNGKNGHGYGLYCYSEIHLVSPLTIDICNNNDQPCGGVGTIAIVDNEGKIIETIYEGREPESGSESDDEPEEDPVEDGGIVNYAPRLRF